MRPGGRLALRADGSVSGPQRRMVWGPKLPCKHTDPKVQDQGHSKNHGIYGIPLCSGGLEGLPSQVCGRFLKLFEAVSGPGFLENFAYGPGFVVLD